LCRECKGIINRDDYTINCYKVLTYKCPHCKKWNKGLFLPDGVDMLEIINKNKGKGEQLSLF